MDSLLQSLHDMERELKLRKEKVGKLPYKNNGQRPQYSELRRGDIYCFKARTLYNFSWNFMVLHHFKIF